MADVFEVFNSTVPPNTPVTAPVTDLQVGSGLWQIVKITFVIPAGHAGLTGIQFWYGGGVAIPLTGGWYSGDDDIERLELGDDFPPGVPWSVAMINSDVIDHSFQTRWEMNYLAANAQTTSAQAVAVSDVYSAAGIDVSGGS